MDLVSLNSIATRLDVDTRIVQGLAMGLGVQVHRVAAMSTVRDADAKRIVDAFTRHHNATAKAKAKRQAAATA